VLQPRIPSTSLYSPSVSTHQSDREHRYFVTFLEKSRHELPGFYQNDFWTQTILQESHHITPVRHAIIAIGALSVSFSGTPAPILKVNVIQEVDKKHHEQAVVHYLKAIQTLNQYISSSSSPQLRVALICCLLFVAFETLLGNISSTIIQIYGGLKILRSYYIGKPGSRPWIPSKRRSNFKKVDTNLVTKSLQTREGCDTISKERAISSHVEEYLNSNLEEETIISLMPPRQSERYPETFKRVEQEDRIGTDITNTESSHEMQGTLTIPIVKGQSSQCLDPVYRSEPLSEILSRQDSENSTIPVHDIASSVQEGAHQKMPMLTETQKSILNPSSSLSASSEKNTTQTSSLGPLSGSLLQNDIPLEQSLIQTFVRLDGHGLFFGMIPAIPPLIWDIHKTHHITIPTSFTTFEYAHRCWDFLMDRALQFFRRVCFNREYAPARCDSDADISRHYKEYLRQLSSFEMAFQPILHQASDPNGKVINPAALIISLFHKATIITLAAIPSKSELVYDCFIEDFRYINRVCSSLITSQNALQVPQNTRFSFEAGIIPPLHVTATKCRDPIVRRQAVDLLFSSPRQEGMWDSVLISRIGRWIIGCEEEGLPAPPLESSGLGSLRETQAHEVQNKWTVPESSRFQLTLVNFHIPDRYIRVKCQRTVPQEDGTRTQRETIIAW
jgi:hypothetical protein